MAVGDKELLNGNVGQSFLEREGDCEMRDGINGGTSMLRPLARTPDGSILAPDGRVLFFSVERFAKDICEGQCCFICGVSPEEAKFNAEHILPRWLLRRHNLYAQTVTLPNGQAYRYHSYTIPCCKDCNSLLGREIEAPLSRVLRGGLRSVNEYIETEGSLRLFTWMALVFLKTHLKDTSLREHLNHGDGEATIAENYDWAIFHHLHCLARSVYTNAQIAPEAFGSLAVLPADNEGLGGRFDFIDLSVAQTLAIRMEDFALFAVFDDSCAVLHGIGNLLEHTMVPLNGFQIREFAAHFACCNLHLKNRPTFRTRTEVHDPPKVYIEGFTKGAPDFEPRNNALFGRLMEQVLGSLVSQNQVGRPTDEALRLMRLGELSFLKDRDGNSLFERPPQDDPAHSTVDCLPQISPRPHRFTTT